MTRNWLWAGLMGLSATGLSLAPGCNTGAIAVKECREIEFARCEASLACGTVEDVDACRLFYRDQCLHGIVGAEEPTADEQNACVNGIERAGGCAEQDPDMSFSSCRDDGMGGLGGAPVNEGPTVCEVIAKPWSELNACGFIDEPAAMGGDRG